MIFDFPPFGLLFHPTRCGFNVMHNTELDISRVNNNQIITINPGDNWHVTYFFKVIERSQALALRATLNRLRGHTHTIRLRDTTYRGFGGFLSPVVVDGGNQYGLGLNVRAIAQPNSLLARATERFRLGESLYELVEDAITDSNGRVRLHLANEVFHRPANNALLVTDISGLTQRCRWQTPNQIEQFQGDRRLYRNITLDFMGAIP
jgi:hypothetical protein